MKGEGDILKKWTLSKKRLGLKKKNNLCFALDKEAKALQHPKLFLQEAFSFNSRRNTSRKNTDEKNR